MGSATVLVACALMIACGSDSPSPMVPSPTPTPAPSPGPATGTLFATVRDDGGTPVANGNVSALVGRAPLARVTTKADGSFQLDNLTLGVTVTLRVMKVPYQDSETEFLVKESNAVAITLHVLQKTMVSGIVRDVETGAPISGAKLFFENSPGAFANAGTQAVSGSDGRYRFDDIYVGNANIRTGASGYNEWVRGLNISGPTTLDFDLRKIEQPVIYTEKVGGPREAWTCVVPGVNGRVFIPEMPCATFPLNMRRPIPATFTATLTSGPGAGGMSFQLICPSTGVVATSVTSDPAGERRLSSTATRCAARCELSKPTTRVRL
jgi:Carboxypeptidase regulatory-like domain